MSYEADLRAGQRIVETVRSTFPCEAKPIDTRLRADYFDTEESPHVWLELFSQLTTDAIKVGEFSKASSHLKLLSALLTSADEPTRRCIDVAYVESLMWDIEDNEIKRKGWMLIPDNLQALYVAMWGEQPFMQIP